MNFKEFLVKNFKKFNFILLILIGFLIVAFIYNLIRLSGTKYFDLKEGLLIYGFQACFLVLLGVFIFKQKKIAYYIIIVYALSFLFLIRFSFLLFALPLGLLTIFSVSLLIAFYSLPREDKELILIKEGVYPYNKVLLKNIGIAFLLSLAISIIISARDFFEGIFALFEGTHDAWYIKTLFSPFLFYFISWTPATILLFIIGTKFLYSKRKPEMVGIIGISGPVFCFITSLFCFLLPIFQPSSPEAAIGIGGAVLINTTIYFIFSLIYMGYLYAKKKKILMAEAKNLENSELPRNSR